MSNENLEEIRKCVDELFLLEQKAENREKMLSQGYHRFLQDSETVIANVRRGIINFSNYAENLGQDFQKSQRRFSQSIKVMAAAVIVTAICVAIIIVSIGTYRGTIKHYHDVISQQQSKINSMPFLKHEDGVYYVRIVPGTLDRRYVNGGVATFAKVDMP